MLASHDGRWNCGLQLESSQFHGKNKIRPRQAYGFIYVDGNPCQVVDIAFHPDTYFFAAKKEFQEMMINIALEAAERQLGERKETLSRDYVILKNLKCKGHDGKPALMPIRYIGGKAYNKGEGPNN